MSYKNQWKRHIHQRLRAKEHYGNVIIIEGVNGIDIWYGNMETSSIKLYDYVESGTYLGTTKDNYLYLVYSKDGQFLNYKEHLK